MTDVVEVAVVVARVLFEALYILYEVISNPPLDTGADQLIDTLVEAVEVEVIIGDVGTEPYRVAIIFELTKSEYTSVCPKSFK